MNLPDLKLIDLTLKAVIDENEWHAVLQHVINVTPAVAAIITLRDGKSCQIVDDDSLVKEQYSPLVCGFSNEAVLYYLKELRTIDPWAEAQKKHYPTRPSLMSEVCSLENLKDKRFFNWLNKFGIKDTIAFELQKMPKYWTACNFFLPDSKKDSAMEVLDYVKLHYSVLRDAWKASQTLIRNRQSGQAVLDQISSMGLPACIIGSNGELHSRNTEFDRLAKLEMVKIVGGNGRLSIGISGEVYGDINRRLSRVLRHDFDGQEFDVSAEPFEPDPLYKGKREQFWLLIFRERSRLKLRSDSYNFDISRLNNQERRLYEGIIDGLSVSGAGESLGLKRSRTFEIWASVKHKLDISHVHEIRILN